MSRPAKPSRSKIFYGRRKGYALSSRQQDLLENRLPKLRVRLPDQDGARLDLERLFPEGEAALWLEIGFGKGEHLAWQAERNEKTGFIGCEPYINGVVGLLRLIEEKGLANVRIFTGPAEALLPALPGASIERVFLLHPDPWPKRRHRKRRFVSAENLSQLARVMRPGAELRIGTDSPIYVDWVKSRMAECDDFRLEWETRVAGEDPGDVADWPRTRYEEKAFRRGAPATRFSYRRV